MKQPLRLLFTVLNIWLCLVAPAIALAQDHTVKGTVKDDQGQPVVGASVFIKGTNKGAITAVDGGFSIAVPAANPVLTISYVGFKTFTANVAGKNTIAIVLEETKSQLNDVVVVGYGTQKKSNLTSAISTISNKDFRDQPVSNLAQSIEGKIPGILVTTPSGTPGAGLLVSVRGASNPLYVVDGIPMISESNSSLSTSYTTDGTVVGQGQNISSISDINPDDIESMQILKDASAAAIYGARAANGVVLITTKHGKNGKTEFSFDSYSGVQHVAHTIPFLDNQGFVALEEDARKQDLKLYNQDPTQFPDGFNPAVLTNPLPNNWKSKVNTNWLDQILRTSPISSIQLSARGGSDKTKFFISGSYFDQQGIVIENYYKRASFRFNLDNKVSERVSIGTTSSFTYAKNRRSFNDDTYTGIVTNALGASPLMPVYNKDGSYADYTQYEASWLSDNPVKSAKEIQAFTKNYRFLGSVFTDIEVLKNLKFRASFSTDYTSLGDDQFFDAITSDASAVGGKAIKGTYTNTTLINENTLTYQNTFAQKHSINLLGGFTAQSTRTENTSINAQGFPEGTGLTNISSASTITGATGLHSGWGLLSFLFRANYAYDDKYLISASIRDDGSSRFDPSRRWGFFPAVSAGWVISKEKFLDGSKWLTNLKLRFSYGLSGDQEIGDFQYQSYYQPSRYDGVSGLKPRNIGNPDLTWQRNKMINAGLDFELYGGKISGSIEAYKGNRTELLSEAPLPATSGFATRTINAGNIQNTGLEFSVSAYPIKTDKFSWTTTLNVSFIKSKILELSSDNQLLFAYSDLFPTHILKVGESVGSFYGYKYLGVDPQTGLPKFSNDQQVLGKATPDYFGGFTNNLRYGDFDLNISTQFSVGNKVYNLIRSTYQTLGWSDGGYDDQYLYQVYANNATIVNKRWRNPGDITDIPRASMVFQNYLQNSSQFIENASFLRIRTVNLGYTIRPKHPKAFSSLRIYLEAQNLATFTKYYGFDPEVSSNGGSSPTTAGVDYAAYPQARTVLLGVNFKF
ncbi:SusC/RagA family TonB-linked outer membrane protein [Mucilaginibacter celer]|uniref:SusC/RagA family TonB-linked outer membrane protein n=1 Tax=Mucilaginibacter celer TaxID=2305508 RepID=A0A494VU72_9SPHI|nr:TonB-dependent receptor [Mucilaginibacter celer]AYL94492.1 SusC/RagA family TonB-linked outer membrane protein [Mucilaginibacter celer]